MARPDSVSAIPENFPTTEHGLHRASFDPNYSVDVMEPLSYNPATGALERALQVDKNWTMRVSNDTSNNPVYQGKAVVGSATSAAVWQVTQFNWSSGNFISQLWADSNENFDNIWDSVSALTYG